jgi:hypothetical protein
MNWKQAGAFNSIDYPEEYKLYGSWIQMGQIDEQFFVATIAEAAFRILKNMHSSVKPCGDITLIFKLNPTEEDGIFETTGGWKCFGKGKEE